jgi:hypothetical protein
MDIRTAASQRDDLLQHRLGEIVPALMRRHDIEAWVIDAREYTGSVAGLSSLEP